MAEVIIVSFLGVILMTFMFCMLIAITVLPIYLMYLLSQLYRIVIKKYGK